MLVPSVEPEAAPDVKDRLHALRQDNPPDEAAKAFAALNRYLADDNATGILQESGGAEVIRFPGREEPAPLTFGAFNQTGVLDGVLIRIGGRDDTVPAHLRDGDTIHLCNAAREMARRLAVHLYGPPLRVHGNGRWERDAGGGWVMKRFNITSRASTNLTMHPLARLLNGCVASREAAGRRSKTPRQSCGICVASKKRTDAGLRRYDAAALRSRLEPWSRHGPSASGWVWK